LIFVSAGAFSLAAALFNWDWFMNAHKARFIVKIFTRNGARIFYGILGLILVVLGVLGMTGIINMSE
jgi:small neutral amino acid transporter SnatA (MarC family)